MAGKKNYLGGAALDNPCAGDGPNGENSNIRTGNLLFLRCLNMEVPIKYYGFKKSWKLLSLQQGWGAGAGAGAGRS